MTEIVMLRGKHNFLILGEVTGVHLRDDCIVQGVFDVTKFLPVARSGYQNYTVVKDVFRMIRPGEE
jgi:flavin reductase (DIM6/NTAB) family NADH-FMN oxidoreductase RutF